MENIEVHHIKQPVPTKTEKVDEITPEMKTLIDMQIQKFIKKNYPDLDS